MFMSLVFYIVHLAETLEPPGNYLDEQIPSKGVHDAAMGRNPKFRGLLGPDATPKGSGTRERECGISSTRQDSLF